ncbi:MAG: hypothetical protein DRN49_00095 [Thaumarchaeota archaeon]|nr:MAG: hypothetical protein DRN49_00095 [Nitrososphaerota archaeon]
MAVCIERGDWWQIWEFKCTGRKIARWKYGKRWIWREPLAKCEKNEWRVLIYKMKSLDVKLKRAEI